MLIYANLCKFMQMSCDVIGHVTALDQSDPSTRLPRGAPGGETVLDQSAAISARPIRTLHFKFQPIRMKQIAPHF